MRRREFIKLLGGTATVWPLAARAQQPAKIARIGFLGLGPAAAQSNRVKALRAGLRDLGYVEGKNVVIEFRWADTVEQLPELAAELVRMNVDVIFATSSTQVEPARQATKTIPIVFATHADPVGIGHVASLSRPGGKHHWIDAAPNRCRRQGPGNVQGCTAAGDADRHSLESHDAVASAGLESSRSCRRDARSFAPDD